MAGGAMGGDDEDIISGINVTPLVDVVLVLLIILMVTATAIVSKTLPVELPTAGTPEETPATPTTLGITIDQDGNLFLDQEPVTESELRARIATASEGDSETRAIIAGDGRVAYARVVRVIDILRSLNVTKFAINVAPEDLEGN